MADRKTDKRLFVIAILLVASAVVLIGIGAGTKWQVPFFIGVILLLLALIPATLAIVGFGRHMTELEKRIGVLESRKQHQD